MAWLLLMAAVVIEVVWATSLKATDGYTRLSRSPAPGTRCPTPGALQ